jgi:hypothetical protein
MLWGSRAFSLAEHENALAEHELVEDLSVRHACHRFANARENALAQHFPSLINM